MVVLPQRDAFRLLLINGEKDDTAKVVEKGESTKQKYLIYSVTSCEKVPQPPLFLPDGAQRAKVAAEQAGENTADRHRKQRKKPCKLAKMSHLFRKLQISFSKLPFSSSRLS